MLSIFQRKYPVYGFGGSIRAMTADEILRMQVESTAAQQSAYMRMLGRSDCAQYGDIWSHFTAPPRRPLDERFADFKRRLAETLAKRKP